MSPDRPARGGRLRGLTAKPWTEAPLLLARYPGILLAVGTAVGILAITAAAGPLFLSSTGNAAFQQDLRSQCAWNSGLQTSSSTLTAGAGFGDGQTYAATDARIRSVGRSIDHIGSVQWQILSDTIHVKPINGVQFPPAIKFYVRPGALDQVRKLTPAAGGGVWLPDRVAFALHLKPGDTFRVNPIVFGARSTPAIPVAGIYRDLAATPSSAFWCGQGQNVYPIADQLPPALVLMDLRTFQAISTQLRGVAVTLTWDLQVEPDGLTVSEASALAATLDASKKAVGIDGFQDAVTVGLHPTVERAGEVVDGMRASVGTIGVAGALVALLVVGGAGVFWLHRRRSEAAVLASKGFGPPALALKVLLEVLPAAILGTGVGWIASVWLVKVFGPSGLLDAGVPAQALRRVAWIDALGVVVLAAVAALAARRETEPVRAGRRSLAGAPWEVAVLLLAAASLYEVQTRGPVRTTPGGAPKVDVLVLLFPILFVAGGAGLASRAIRRLLPLLRRAGRRWSPALYLATRRLAGAPTIALALVTCTGLAVGILAYANVISASVRATSDAKAKVFTGSDLAVSLAEPIRIPASLAGRATIVGENGQGTLLPDQDPVAVMGVDPSTLSRAAFWDPAFGAGSLQDVVGKLSAPSGSGPLPVIAAGDIGAGTSVSFRQGAAGSVNAVVDVPFRVVATVRAFPGMTSGRPLLIGLNTALRAKGVHLVPVLWARGNADQALATLRAAKAPVLITVTSRDAESTPAFLAVNWTFGFLQSLGLIIGLIVLGGMLLYLEAYQRTRAIAFALAGRMGLSRTAHRWSVAVELAGMLTAGTLVGMFLAWGAGRLLFGRLDLVPSLPPPPLFRTPLGLFAVTLLAVAAISWLGAWGVQRSAERANVTEVIRVAG